MFFKHLCRFKKAFCKDLQNKKRYFGTANFIKKGFKFPNYKVILGPTADEVTQGIDLTGKTCLITGGTSGIGLEMTRCLLSRNCKMLMACRNTYAAGIVAKNFSDYNPNERFKVYETNLASMASVTKCANRLLKDHKNIDIVLLNAAVFGIPWRLTEDGLETTFQVNYLSQFYLLKCIEPILAPNARVVILSTESHRNVRWTLKNTLEPTKELVSLPEDQFTSIKAYNISKLCGLLAMRHLGNCWTNSAKSVFCAHPGSFVYTKLCTNWWPFEALYILFQPFSKTVDQAASTPLYCATSPDLEGVSGVYLKDCKVTQESDLAQDSYLSYRMYDLTQSIIRECIANTEHAELETKKLHIEEETKGAVETAEETVAQRYQATN